MRSEDAGNGYYKLNNNVAVDNVGDISEKINDEEIEKYSTTVPLLPFDKCGLINSRPLKSVQITIIQ